MSMKQDEANLKQILTELCCGFYTEYASQIHQTDGTFLIILGPDENYKITIEPIPHK